MLSVVNSCHYNENFINGKHRLWTNALPSGAAPTNPHPPGKSLDAEALGRGQVFGANPRGARGEGLVIDEIDTCIIETFTQYCVIMRTLLLKQSRAKPKTLDISTQTSRMTMLLLLHWNVSGSRSLGKKTVTSKAMSRCLGYQVLQLLCSEAMYA